MSSVIKVDTIQSAAGSTILGQTNSTTITLGVTGQTITVPSGATLTNNGTATGFPDNTPSFLVRLSGNQSVANTTNVRINFDVEDVDTDNAFDTSTYRFTVPSGKDGKYFIGYSMATDAVVDDGERMFGRIYLNGSGQLYTTANDWSPATNQDLFVNYSVIMNLSAGDYLELYMYHNEGGAINCNNAYTRFWGFKLIGV